MRLDNVALFPLGTVLFPGGVLPLRIFETRYMDMARECLREDQPFGVCLITEGSEVGAVARHEPVGCLARITDCDMEQIGVLLVRTIGTDRFRVDDTRVERSGLIRATVTILAEDPQTEVPGDLADCAMLARRIVEDLESRETDSQLRMIAQPYAFESASWVGNRLAEVLPLPLAAKQRLMEIDDPLTRLALLQRFLQEHQVL
ncbi:MAG: LON peptidase substrate-binding domain-containing protein [Burkholderiales bacterium]|nr:MAG: LON peptidase substrate-binding domain-containing protein [Burkholderiales bacterium]